MRGGKYSSIINKSQVSLLFPFDRQLFLEKI
jgi:hypothetical protein